MKIERVEALPTTFPDLLGEHLNLCIVRIEAEGVVGWGEICDSYCCTFPTAYVPLVHDVLGPLLVGEELVGVDALTRRLRTWARRRLGDAGMAIQAVSGLELALWDLAGKRDGVSVSAMIGRVRDRIPMYQSGKFLDLPAGDHQQLFGEALDRGATAVKVRASLDPAHDLRVLAELQELLPDGTEVLVDGNEHFSVTTARRFAAGLADLGVYALGGTGSPVRPSGHRPARRRRSGADRLRRAHVRRRRLRRRARRRLARHRPTRPRHRRRAVRVPPGRVAGRGLRRPGRAALLGGSLRPRLGPPPRRLPARTCRWSSTASPSRPCGSPWSATGSVGAGWWTAASRCPTGQGGASTSTRIACGPRRTSPRPTTRACRGDRWASFEPRPRTTRRPVSGTPGTRWRSAPRSATARGRAVLDRPWVLVRLDGELRAFEDRCPHRMAPLRIGTVLATAPSSASTTAGGSGPTGAAWPSRPGDGAPIPARARLRRRRPGAERYGLVWLAPEDPVATCPTSTSGTTTPSTPTGTSPAAPRSPPSSSARTSSTPPTCPRCTPATFGVADAGYLPPARSSTTDGGRGPPTRSPYRNHDDPLVATGEHPLEQPQRLYKEVCPATTALVRLDFPLTGKTIAILFPCRPSRRPRPGSSR